MPRVKKTDAFILTEENKKLSDEIAKARKKIAENEAKMKENAEKIQMEQLGRITSSGYKLDEVAVLIEAMAKKGISVQDIMSLIDDEKASENKYDEKDNAETTDQNAEIDKMMASLPSYD